MPAKPAKKPARGGGGEPAEVPAMTIDEFLALPDEEKEAHYREVDREFTPAETRPLTAEDRRRWQRAKRKMGRPKVGKGAKTISLTVERDLLKRADAYAKRLGVSRAQLVAAGLEAVMRDGAAPKMAKQ